MMSHKNLYIYILLLHIIPRTYNLSQRFDDTSANYNAFIPF